MVVHRSLDNPGSKSPPRSSPFASTGIVIALVAALATALGIAVALSFGWVSRGRVGTVDEFSKVAGLWAGFITAAMTASMAMLSGLFQSRATARLEAARSELANQLETMRAENAEALEQVKGDLARTLEFTKGRYAAERKAYDELLGAVYTYYYTLSSLEIGGWDSAQVGKADDGMVATCRYLVAVEEIHRKTWVDFWQGVRDVRDMASDISPSESIHKPNSEGRSSPSMEPAADVKERLKSLWAKKVGALGGAVAKLEEAAVARHRSPEGQ